MRGALAIHRLLVVQAWFGPLTPTLSPLKAGGRGSQMLTLSHHKSNFGASMSAQWKRLVRGFLRFAFDPTRKAHDANRRTFPLKVETLEDRVVPNGTWTDIASSPPNSLGTMFLLPNGAIMVQEGGISNAFYELKPDASGGYVNGTWSTLAPMIPTTGDADGTRLYYGTVVMPNDTVMIYGGEYADSSDEEVEANSGVLYNMATNSWTAVPVIPNSLFKNTNAPNTFGDSPLELLPDGNVLAGFNDSNVPFLYDPTTQTWSDAGTKLDGPGSNNGYEETTGEEGLTKLPGMDGNLMDYELWASLGQDPGYAEIYDSSTNQWVAGGTVPVALSNTNEFELGPAVLLPPTTGHADGQVFQVGANGEYPNNPTNTACYDVATGKWSAGPQIPGGYTADDASAAVLPDGNVIFTADSSSERRSPRRTRLQPECSSTTWPAIPSANSRSPAVSPTNSTTSPRTRRACWCCPTGKWRWWTATATSGSTRKVRM